LRHDQLRVGRRLREVDGGGCLVGGLAAGDGGLGLQVDAVGQRATGDRAEVPAAALVDDEVAADDLEAAEGAGEPDVAGATVVQHRVTNHEPLTRADAGVLAGVGPGCVDAVGLAVVAGGGCLRYACRGDQGCRDAAQREGRSQHGLHARTP
jgi:hypothetical protein